MLALSDLRIGAAVPARTADTPQSKPVTAPPELRSAHPAGAAIRLTVVLLALATAYVVATRWDAWTGAAVDQTTEDAYLAADLTPLAARVAGYVRAVPVGDYQRVRRGDLLIELVADDYQARVHQAEGTIATTQGRIAELEASKRLQLTRIQGAEAQMAATVAILTRNRLEVERQRALIASGMAGTRQAVERADADAKQAAANFAGNQADLAGAREQLAILEAQVKQQEGTLGTDRAQLKLSSIDLAYTRITAPADGIVGQRQVRPGQYVSAGAQVIALVPLPNVWVVANYKETQITRVRVGQPASVAVDTFPGRILSGHVDSISPGAGSQFSLLPPDNATGNFTKVVQRVPVKIVLDDAGDLTDLLRPGMSVVATIHTRERSP